jgi:hypothetical protein
MIPEDRFHRILKMIPSILIGNIVFRIGKRQTVMSMALRSPCRRPQMTSTRTQMLRRFLSPPLFATRWFLFNSQVTINLSISSSFPIKRSELYVNDRYISSNESTPSTLTFIPQSIGLAPGSNTIKVIVYDNALNKGEATAKRLLSRSKPQLVDIPESKRVEFALEFL